MKKIVVISDNHGQQSMLDKIRKLESDSDYYVHCGDSEALEERLKAGFVFEVIMTGLQDCKMK
ncbi:hypothetical protein [Thomasclavelia cocleata]|uniref:hypothetical protein n=1 Tax=Thomasclavelia cocleata TaxID=69824 RepID=UPI00255AB268|nr:hypothetical protein [Thomasclavelia cocleata]